MKKIISLLVFLFSFSLYAQNDTLSSAKTSNIAVVSADKMNVVYRGIPNPISIYIPNVKNFIATGSNLKKISKGKYILNPSVGEYAVIRVAYKNTNGKPVIEKHKFKILGIPQLNLVMNDSICYSICNRCVLQLSKKELKNAVLKYEGNKFFNYEIHFDISGMWLIFSDEKTIRIEGNVINNEAFDEINKLKTGEIFTIRTSLMSQADIFIPTIKIMIADDEK